MLNKSKINIDNKIQIDKNKLIIKVIQSNSSNVVEKAKFGFG